MFKALYDYKGVDDNTLSFKFGDVFTVIHSANIHWWLVQNGNGSVGYVPGNYLAELQGTRNDVVKSIDRAIQAIHASAERNGGNLNEIQKNNLLKLNQHRKNVISEQTGADVNSPPTSPSQCKGPAPQPPSSTAPAPDVSSKSKSSKTASRRSSKRSAPAPPNRQLHYHSSIEEVPLSPPEETPLNESQPISIPGQGSSMTERHRIHRPPHATVDELGGGSPYGSPGRFNSPGRMQAAHLTGSPGRGGMVLPKALSEELVELVRRQTDLSAVQSRAAVVTVVTHLRDTLPAIQGVMDDVLREVLQERSCDLATSQDAERLAFLLQELTACKEDSQQRSWALHEDEDMILGYLQELWSILMDADPKICLAVLLQDNFNAIHNLVLYYQMETRVSIRLVLLRVFGTLCGLDPRIISEFLTSVLPLELARDMQSDIQDVTKFKHSALVLTMVFSMGESVPIHHYDHLSHMFITFIIETVESAEEWLSPDDLDDVLDLLVNLLLAFNLHFEMPSDNPILEVLSKRHHAKVFTEKLLTLFNRGDDPVKMFDHEPQPPHSLLKFMTDLFSSPNTSGLFYTNDARVLLDIVIRMIADLSPGDKIRTEYLSLTHLIIKNSNYREHEHRVDEFQRCFQRIGTEEQEGEQSEMDKDIVRQIWREFSEYFQPKESVESNC